MLDEFNKIKTPKELLEFMKKYINYGYLGKSGKVYKPCDEGFNNSWYSEYVLQNWSDLLKTTYGNCWDQVELERYWFLKHGYEVRTLFEGVNVSYNNNFPTHTYLVYKDTDESWNWFENADVNNFGIHKFNNLEELINKQLEVYKNKLMEYNISKEELNKVIILEYKEPNYGIGAGDYLEFINNSPET